MVATSALAVTPHSQAGSCTLTDELTSGLRVANMRVDTVRPSA